MSGEKLTRPIIGIESRTAQEVFDIDIMCDRNTRASGWQPIETAPKDGTPFIGAFFSIRWADSHRKNDIVRCWWQPEFEAFISSCREMVMAEGYTINGKSRELHSPAIEPVTHWMPLPPTPQGEG